MASLLPVTIPQSTESTDLSRRCGGTPSARFLMPADPLPGRQHVLTVGLEEYFHADAFSGVVGSHRWARFDRRLERGLDATLDLLDDASARATFFVLGWLADHSPELVRRISDRGHTIASRGYSHRSIRSLPTSAWLDDLSRARESIERASGTVVRGHRAARLWYHPGDLRALDLLAAAGYTYDSSLAPILRRFTKMPERLAMHEHRAPGGQTIVELPISTVSLLGLRLPFSGGNYLRQLPSSLVATGIERWLRDGTAPMVLYFHTWELDPAQPRLPAPLVQRIRHYRNLDRFRDQLAQLLAAHSFRAVEDILSPERTAPGRTATLRSRGNSGTAVQPCTVVVPVRDEEAMLPALLQNVRDATLRCAPHEPRWLFVDDGSRDRSWHLLNEAAAHLPAMRVLRLPEPQGIAAAIRCGVLHASTPAVFSARAGEIEAIPEFIAACMGTSAQLVMGVSSLRPLPAATRRNAILSWLLGSARPGLFGTLRRYDRGTIAGLRLEMRDGAGLGELVTAVELAGGRADAVLLLSGITPIAPAWLPLARLRWRGLIAGARRRKRRWQRQITGGVSPHEPEFGL